MQVLGEQNEQNGHWGHSLDLHSSLAMVAVLYPVDVGGSQFQVIEWMTPVMGAHAILLCRS